MNKFKGTPPPWSIDRRYCDCLPIVDSQGFNIVDVDRVAILAAWDEKGFEHWGDKGGHREMSDEEYAANVNVVVMSPELLELAIAALAWIDAVPSDTVLPVMPGFDRDWADSIVNKALGSEG